MFKGRAAAPVIFFDFDNTITVGDVLDRVIERYSASEAWRDWETAWQAGQMSTPECLRRQLGDLRVSSEELHKFLSEVAIDPAFPSIVEWATAREADLRILSDNFSPFIHAILDRHALPTLPVCANEFVLTAGRFQARFPFRDASCPRCAHCKAQHLRKIEHRPRIFVGDGLSDVCPSLVADVVFAKDSLAAELTRRGVSHRRYRALDEVLLYLVENHPLPLPA